MNTTSSHLPICVHCGTPRPADETLCPVCGNPWIDTTIEPAHDPDRAPHDAEPGDESARGVADAAGSFTRDTASRTESESDTSGEDPASATVTESTADLPLVPHQTAAGLPPLPPSDHDDTGEFSFDDWDAPVEPDFTDRRTAWLVPAGIAAAVLVALGILVFSRGGTPLETAGSLTTTMAPATTTSQQATTTSLETTTTELAFPLPGDWAPKGDPIPTSELTLKQSAIGPIAIGASLEDVAGMLTASLGEATDAGVDGLCPPDEAYRLTFGQLTTIFDGTEPSSSFVSYRYDQPQGSDDDLGLKTLSGIAIGDTVDDLITTYTQFTISFEIIDAKDYFRLSDGGELLLWGPVSSVDPEGFIEGIYSPTACSPGS